MRRGNQLLRRLEKEVLLLDGAMGTELQKSGIHGNTALSNVQKPDIVASIHRAYLEAGADILETNTFAGGRYALRREDKLTSEKILAKRYNLPGVQILKKVIGSRKDIYIAGSIGPIGKLVASPKKRHLARDIYYPGW